MITLKASPRTYYDTPEGRRYYSGEDGLVDDVHPLHVDALLKAGCSQEKPNNEARYVLFGAPGQWYQPAPGVTYRPDQSGKLMVRGEHISALLNAGCQHDVAKIKMKGIEGRMYRPDPSSNWYYRAGRSGFFYAFPDHIPALLSAGCTRQDQGTW